jgi:hypothetical protein
MNTDNNTIGHEPKLWSEKVDDIQGKLLQQAKNPNLFSEEDIKNLEALSMTFPLEYKQAVSEIASENSKNKGSSKRDKETLDMDTISQNLKESGSSSKLAA